MTYDEVNGILVRHAPAVIHLFADKWSRWPSEAAAATISAALEARAAMWEQVFPDDVAVRDEIRAAIAAINGAA